MEIFQTVHIAKNEKMCSEENTKGETDQLFNREISVGENHGFKQPPQQKPGIGIRLYQH